MNPASPQGSNSSNQRQRPFLGIHYVRCGTYGRIYRNKEGNAYVGHCPRLHASGQGTNWGGRNR